MGKEAGKIKTRSITLRFNASFDDLIKPEFIRNTQSVESTQSNATLNNTPENTHFHRSCSPSNRCQRSRSGAAACLSCRHMWRDIGTWPDRAPWRLWPAAVRCAPPRTCPTPAASPTPQTYSSRWCSAPIQPATSATGCFWNTEYLDILNICVSVGRGQLCSRGERQVGRGRD